MQNKNNDELTNSDPGLGSDELAQWMAYYRDALERVYDALRRGNPAIPTMAFIRLAIDDPPTMWLRSDMFDMPVFHPYLKEQAVEQIVEEQK